MQNHSYTPKDGFPYYFDLVKDMDLLDAFSSLSVIQLLQSISEEKSSYRYAPGKWSIKQVIGHLTDHERIKMSRAFQLSRKEKIQLWGYDQDYLVNNSRFEELPFQLLVDDFLSVRKSSLSFIKTLSKDQLEIIGSARQYKITLHDFLKSIIGHEIHHINVLKEKYL